MTRRGRITTAWLLFAACAALVLYLGSDEFHAGTTGSLLGPVIDWLFPDWTALERWHLHRRLRKLAHAIEYGILALLAFNAVFITLKTLLARIAGLALLLVCAVAGIDELRQSFSATRRGAFGDVILDLSGAALALTIVVLLHWRRGRARPTEPT